MIDIQTYLRFPCRCASFSSEEYIEPSPYEGEDGCTDANVGGIQADARMRPFCTFVVHEQGIIIFHAELHVSIENALALEVAEHGS